MISRLSGKTEILRRFNCSLFIVHFSFVIAGDATFHNGK